MSNMKAGQFSRETLDRLSERFLDILILLEDELLEEFERVVVWYEKHFAYNRESIVYNFYGLDDWTEIWEDALTKLYGEISIQMRKFEQAFGKDFSWFKYIESRFKLAVENASVNEALWQLKK